jgi:hypothetical protein
MPPVSHSYRLGKDHTFAFASSIANKDVKSVTVTRETAVEGEVTTRGSDNVQEFVPIRQNTTLEVVVLDHSCVMHATGVATVTPPTGTATTGPYYVNNIGEPQEIDGVVEYTITLKRFVGV